MSPGEAGSSAPRRALWRSGPARDVLLVVLGAALALAAEDSTRIAAAQAKHLRIVDTLEAYARRRALPPREIYLYGMFNPAAVSGFAWQAARETGALSDMPLATVLGLARVYELQERYRALGQALNVGIMDDVRRDGMDVVLRDRFTQFIPLATDFANREGNLLEHYRRALASLDEGR
jgi:hypothetical protein